MLGSEVIEGADSWKIETTPKKSRSSHYTRSIAWIRKDNDLQVRLDNFVDDEVVKRLTSSNLESIQGIWTARLLEMADLRRRTRTRLTLQAGQLQHTNERSSVHVAGDQALTRRRLGAYRFRRCLLKNCHMTPVVSTSFLVHV